MSENFFWVKLYLCKIFYMLSVSENIFKMKKKKKANYASMYMYALFRHIYVCTAADEISTSLQPAAWERSFQIHLDQEVAQSSGKFGEGSGRGRNHSCKSAHTNTSSAPENPEVVEKFLQSKRAVARMVQVPEPESVKGLHTMQPVWGDMPAWPITVVASDSRPRAKCE